MQSSRLVRTLARLSAGGLVALALTLSACGASSSVGGGKGSTTIKICSDLPVSGADASAGKPAQNGITLAINQANARHTIAGYTLVHVPYDNVGAGGVHDPAVGANNVDACIGDALVAGDIGPFNSSVAAAEMPKANLAGLALISPSNTNETLTKPQFGQTGVYRPTGKTTYFRVCTTDDIQGPAMAVFFHDKLNAKTVAIVDDTEVYGKGIAGNFENKFKALGGTVLSHDEADKSVTDFTPILTKIASENPDSIYFGGNDSTGGIRFRNQMVQVAGLATKIFGGGDGIQTSAFVTATGAAGVGSYSTVASVNPDVLTGSVVTDFKAAFTAAFPKPEDYGAYSANAYDATNILILAIKNALAKGAVTPKDSNDSAQAKVFRKAVIDELAKTNYDGVIGKTTFDENGDTSNRWISFYQVTNTGGKIDWTFKDQLQYAAA